MILYHPPQNRSWKPLQGKALRLLIFNTSAVERQRFERKAIRPYPPALSLSRERGRVPSGHGVQKIYKNTAPVFVGSGVLRKVDSPFIVVFLYALVKGRYYRLKTPFSKYSITPKAAMFPSPAAFTY